MNQKNVQKNLCISIHYDIVDVIHTINAIYLLNTTSIILVVYKQWEFFFVLSCLLLNFFLRKRMYGEAG